MIWRVGLAMLIAPCLLEKLQMKNANCYVVTATSSDVAAVEEGTGYGYQKGYDSEPEYESFNDDLTANVAGLESLASRDAAARPSAVDSSSTPPGVGGPDVLHPLWRTSSTLATYFMETGAELKMAAT